MTKWKLCLAGCLDTNLPQCDVNAFAMLAKLNSVTFVTNWPHFLRLYLDSVWLYKMHVQCGGVGENLATSFHGAEDVGPHFFGQLRDGGLYYFPWLRHFVTLGAVRSCVPSVIRLGPHRRGHVFILIIHPALDSSSTELTIAKHSQVSHQARLKGCSATVQKRNFRFKFVISGEKCFRFSK